MDTPKMDFLGGFGGNLRRLDGHHTDCPIRMRLFLRIPRLQCSTFLDTLTQARTWFVADLRVARRSLQRLRQNFRPCLFAVPTCRFRIASFASRSQFPSREMGVPYTCYRVACHFYWRCWRLLGGWGGLFHRSFRPAGFVHWRNTVWCCLVAEQSNTKLVCVVACRLWASRICFRSTGGTSKWPNISICLFVRISKRPNISICHCMADRGIYACVQARCTATT